MILYYTVLYYTVLYYMILYYIILYVYKGWNGLFMNFSVVSQYPKHGETGGTHSEPTWNPPTSRWYTFTWFLRRAPAIAEAPNIVSATAETPLEVLLDATGCAAAAAAWLRTGAKAPARLRRKRKSSTEICCWKNVFRTLRWRIVEYHDIAPFINYSMWLGNSW